VAGWPLGGRSIPPAQWVSPEWHHRRHLSVQ